MSRIIEFRATEYVGKLSFLYSTLQLVYLLTASTLAVQGQTTSAPNSVSTVSTQDSIEVKMCRLTDYIIEVFRKKYHYVKPQDTYYMRPPAKYYWYDQSEFPIQKPYEHDFFIEDFNKNSHQFNNLKPLLATRYSDFAINDTIRNSVWVDKVIFNREWNKVAINFTMHNGPHSFYSTKQILIENVDKTWKCETIILITQE